MRQRCFLAASIIIKVNHRSHFWLEYANDPTRLFACNDYCNSDGVFHPKETAPAALLHRLHSTGTSVNAVSIAFGSHG
jgi:hypothetical protein